mmetsp:Transcript_12511/g.22084  ORF Transcript_12511/g.22084 Transcript_12511/m.22084 type:complete len:288 (+) Transcript_12511:47-910(+)|eukprot:CAMPEP_0197630082 /NCGR_PEP_ID=MMETSP1338-20131121/7683_1 /TAXON_ID=43686 ORGANISM="Pelagodinium beii, Strain RCC1491" /NCGR_SAMPLE_ID=MMETSP1338 /ASSEMBLY_ACC=CAM_ASM_000754 /LENGTH=287 /DNA_ID=CAMNT_0043201227 /DNA_START=42 /DNA_END=905 /DNA_ORIENTATION=-
MGVAQNKCCTPPQDVPTEPTPVPDAKSVVEDLDLAAKPLWLIEAEEAKALRAIQEEEAAKRVAELAAKKQAEMEAKRKAEEEAAAAAAEEASKEAAPKKKAATKKKAAAKAAAQSADVVPVVKKKTPEELKREAEVKKSIDEATKAASDTSAVRYDVEVKVVSARNLRDADWAPGGGTSDPYCLCESLGKAKARFKTKTVNDAENPVWNQAAKMQLGQGDTLKFTINDEDTGKEDDLLGWSQLKFDQIVPSGFEGELKLRDASDTAKARDAYLKVRVKILGASTAAQ